MSIQPLPTEPLDLDAQRAEDVQYLRGALHCLIDVGTSMARRVEQQHAEAAKPTTTPAAEPATAPAQPTAQDFALAYERIARAVRRTIMLACKLAEPAAKQRPAQHPAQHRAAARRQIIRAVEDSIQRSPGDPDALHHEMLDRLDTPDVEDDILSRPIEDIITEIRHDLCLDPIPYTHPWKRRSPADVIALYARAAQPAGAPHDPIQPEDVIWQGERASQAAGGRLDDLQPEDVIALCERAAEATGAPQIHIQRSRPGARTGSDPPS